MPLPSDWGKDEEAEDEPPRKPYYPNEAVWMHEWFLPTFGKEWSTRVQWCLQWWEHPEARAVIKAMWLSWEEARLKPPVMAGWYRDVAYPLYDRLISQEGPFIGCSYGWGTEPVFHDDRKPPMIRELPHDPIPDGFFQSVECEWVPEG